MDKIQNFPNAIEPLIPVWWDISYWIARYIVRGEAQN